MVCDTDRQTDRQTDKHGSWFKREVKTCACMPDKLHKQIKHCDACQTLSGSPATRLHMCISRHSMAALAGLLVISNMCMVDQCKHKRCQSRLCLL